LSALFILNEQKIDHQPNNFAGGGEVLPGGFTGKLGKLADEFFKYRTHLGIADGLGMQVDIGEFFRDELEQPGFDQIVDLGVELEAPGNVTHHG
jgi:hypothetical protein